MLDDTLRQAASALRLGRLEIANRFEKCFRGQEVSCKKKCSHCCHYPVQVSLLEAISILEKLKDQGSWSLPLKETLRQHALSVRSLDLTIWALSGVPCPLLIGGLCSVYDGRPMACRLAASFTIPDFCAVSNLTATRPHIPNGFFKREFDTLELDLSRKAGVRLVRLPISEMLLRVDMLSTGRLNLDNVFTSEVNL